MKPGKIALIIIAFCILAAGTGFIFKNRLKGVAIVLYQTFRVKRTSSQRVVQYRDGVYPRLKPLFEKVKVEYPPKRITLVSIKADRLMQVWVMGNEGVWKHLKDYPVLGQSGHLGPKLREGDGQVPEGIYQVESLNPNSILHLALHVGYPNEFDVHHGKEDGRTNNLGSDIMIHGGKSSAGCLAVGNLAAEDLFLMAAETGPANVRIIITPVDFRVAKLPANLPPLPAWTPELYASIQSALGSLSPPVSAAVSAKVR